MFPSLPPSQVFEGWAYWHALGVTQHPELREAALGLLRQVGRTVCPDQSMRFVHPGLLRLPSDAACAATYAVPQLGVCCPPCCCHVACYLWAGLAVCMEPLPYLSTLGLPLPCPQIAAALHPAGRQLVLAVPPLVPAPGRQAQLSERDVEELLAFVDGLSGAEQNRLACVGSRAGRVDDDSWQPKPGRPQALPACRCAAPATAATSAEFFSPHLHGWRPQHAATLCAVMTYDYSSAQQPGPNAPLPWVQQNADAFAVAADRWAPIACAVRRAGWLT